MVRVVAALAATALGASSSMNPIRRVVSMLQMMQKKVENEADEAKALHTKFMCYCDTNEAKMSKKIQENEEKIPQVESEIKELKGQKEQVESEITAHNSDRAEAQEAVDKATSMRAKDQKSFEAEAGDIKANLDAIRKAIPAIEQGGATEFLQSRSAARLRKLIAQAQSLDDSDRDDATAFLQGGNSIQPGSAQIVGILKQMEETIAANLADITKTEDEAVKSFEDMKAAKEKEISAATKAIEVKTGRVGELAVSIVEAEDDLKDTGNTLDEDKEFASTLKEKCSTAVKEYETESATRQEELAAIADTIKLLNSDEALELFKKALPSMAQMSFLQMDESEKEMKQEALQALQQHHTSKAAMSPYLSLVAFALKGKKANFDKVTKLIDNMMSSLKKEQGEDDSKKEYCASELDKAEDEAKEHENDVKGLKAKIEQLKDAASAVKAEIADLEAGIKSLDEAVAEATEQRKKEHDHYTKTAAQNQGALELLEMAKNRLNKFFNPEVAKSDDDLSFIQTKQLKSAGVIAMLTNIQTDLKTEMAEDEQEEKDAQAEYEKLMETSQSKRKADSEAITEKSGALSDAEEGIAEAEGDKKTSGAALLAVRKTISNLHGECDFLVQNYDLRKQARDDEINALDKAKAVLSGADFSLVQTSSFLTRRG
mmetsp:Transcript_40416/g.85388  ORF Transcript_40416/g.85388 Transcript_40416/m.85388 type:complete len:658 (+) Transcript_40416:95-2068(+)